jgi:hypothetical protein
LANGLRGSGWGFGGILGSTEDQEIPLNLRFEKSKEKFRISALPSPIETISKNRSIKRQYQIT